MSLTLLSNLFLLEHSWKYVHGQRRRKRGDKRIAIWEKMVEREGSGGGGGVRQKGEGGIR